jgi:hypothetical protein
MNLSILVAEDLNALRELVEDLTACVCVDDEVDLFLLKRFWVELLGEDGFNLYVAAEDGSCGLLRYTLDFNVLCLRIISLRVVLLSKPE